jgi:hypothetical protein
MDQRTGSYSFTVGKTRPRVRTGPEKLFQTWRSGKILLEVLDIGILVMEILFFINEPNAKLFI